MLHYTLTDKIPQLSHFTPKAGIIVQARGRRIMANMPAFQASDASSILAARTKVKASHLGCFYFGLRPRMELASMSTANQMKVRVAQCSKISLLIFQTSGNREQSDRPLAARLTQPLVTI